MFRDFPTFSRICIFFLLTLSLLLFFLLIFLFSLPLHPCSAFHLSILSEVWLLTFLRLYIFIFYLPSCQFSCHIQGARERGSDWGRLEAEVSDNPAESAESPPGERVRVDSDRFSATTCYKLQYCTSNYYTITVRPKTLSSASLWKCFSSHKIPRVWERNCFFAHFAQVFRDTWTFGGKVFELDAR